MQIETFEGRLEPAYVNIRFKTLKEILEEEPEDYDETKSIIRQFLKNECVYS